MAPSYVIDFTVGWSFGEPQLSRQADSSSYKKEVRAKAARKR